MNNSSNEELINWLIRVILKLLHENAILKS